MTRVKYVTKRPFAGYYTLTKMIDGVATRQVLINYHPHLNGWIAAADWNQHFYTDPISTYRVAKMNAMLMLES